MGGLIPGGGLDYNLNPLKKETQDKIKADKLLNEENPQALKEKKETLRQKITQLAARTFKVN
ncbi:MAG: hypothetical protein HYU63_03415 [Armatimonadetes bacterium]|nr:hypothetical protein [Armatimonadota bacterium]